MYKKQEHNYPIASWNLISENDININSSHFYVKHVMSTDIFLVKKEDSLQLVKNIMAWKKIRHMPVVDEHNKIVGLITNTDVQDLSNHAIEKGISVEDVMIKNLITISQYESLEAAKNLMQSNQINCLPVVENGSLIGLITSKDFLN